MSEVQDLFGWVGATIEGKYRVDAVVGEGGFGVVYRAHHLGFDQTVAIKCLRLPKTLSSPERERFRETFLAEGRLLHQLSRATAGIVQALDLGAAVSPNKHWTPYLVLEWLEGRGLDRDFADRRKQQRGGRSLAESVTILGQAARALAVAHAEGVAHRDIKPANLFLAQLAGREVLKVLDFGIAKVMSETESVTRAFEETGASTQAFTAKYGAPEQFSRRYGATGPWTDVFALALVLVEMVTGRAALDGSDATQLFIAAADPDRRPTLRHHGFATGDGVEGVLRQALAVDPRQRFASADKFWDALELACANETGSGQVVAAASLSPRASDASGNAPTATENPPAATDLNAFRPLPSSRSPRASFATRAVLVAGALSLGVGAGAVVVGRTMLKRETPHVSASAPPLLNSTTTAASAVESAPSNAPPAVPAPAPTPREPPAPTDAPPAEVASSESPSSLALPPVDSAPAASAAAIEAPPRIASATPPTPPLPGVPVRDITAGPIGDGYIAGYKLYARRNAGLDFWSASRECTSLGLALCSSEQWAHACSQYPELAASTTWSSSLDGERVIVRGGQSCASTGSAEPGEHNQERLGFCCDRAISMTTDNLQKAYLSTTAERILAVERALNQHNVRGLLDLSESSVTLDARPKTQNQLRALLEADFKASPDQVVLNDRCMVSVQAKKIVQPAKRHKKKKVIYQTQGWTAKCQQTAVGASSVAPRGVNYGFSANSKLKEIETAIGSSAPAPPK